MATAQQVSDGIYRLGTEWVGWYLIVDDAVTVVDCGFPGYHDQLPSALAELDRPLEAVTAIVLTHAHPDHVGSAEPIRAEAGATVYAPVGDAERVRSGEMSLPPGFAASLWRPRMLRYLAHAGRNGGARVPPVTELRTYEDGEVLAEAGGLRAVHTPGHTAGHFALHAERAGVLFCGDALATVSHLTGETGPRLLPFNEDPGLAFESLSRIEDLAADLLLVGHGDPFEGAPAEAVASARAVAG